MSNNNPFASTMEKIRDLPVIQKVILIFVVIAGFYLIGYFLLQGSTQPVEEKPDTTINQPTEQPVVSTSPEPVDLLDGKLDKNNVPTVDGKQLPAITSGNKLSVAESRKALKVAETGAVEFTSWDQKESLDSRMKRLNKVFSKESVSKGLSMTGSSPISSDYYEDEKIPKYAYYSEVNSSTIVGGNDDRFRVSIGLKVRFAKVDKNTGQLDSVIREQYPIYTVDLAKQGDNWKILEIANDGE